MTRDLIALFAVFVGWALLILWLNRNGDLQ